MIVLLIASIAALVGAGLFARRGEQLRMQALRERLAADRAVDEARRLWRRARDRRAA